MMFVNQLLGSMKITVKYQIMVRVDNIGTIFMASNIATMPCNRHVDVRYKYVNMYVKDRIVNIIFVKSADNESDILTKKFKCRAS